MQWMIEGERRVRAQATDVLLWCYAWLSAMWVMNVVAPASWLERVQRRQPAQGFIEYAVLVGLLGVAVIVALTAFAPLLAGVFNRFGVRLGGYG